MKKVQIELVKAWFIKAQHDLGTAHKLSKGPDPFLDTAIYHCQQAAEKSIKGFLVYHNQRFEKTHDLRPMIDMAAKIDTEFSELMDAAELLTPYATEFRYPCLLYTSPSPRDPE